MNQVPIDAQVVIRKLQDRLADAIGTIAILEAQVEALQTQMESVEKVNTNGASDSTVKEFSAS